MLNSEWPGTAYALTYSIENLEGAIMDLQLSGKLVLVTGSTAGIGLAIGSTLAGEGATVMRSRHE